MPECVDDVLLGITVDHNRAPEQIPAGKGFVTIYSCSQAAKRLLGEPDDALIAELQPRGERLLGPLGELEWIEVDRWPQVVVESHPGYYAQLHEFHVIRHARDRRVQLAGDYFSSSNVNTATSAPERAARELAAVLRTPVLRA